ncbi:hypothetical protein [Sinorhizobium sp. BJ1]|uniref:hypothetical protein n=1 Tax=Sinorhizobium sp. BJ1 TaxID=2035455 RepID=UPI001184A0A5|nr:hypothetical protein [Sinorhizobium sp. BJ1]
MIVVLQGTQAAAANELLLQQSRTLMATRLRLLAEPAGNDAVLFPNEMLAEDDPGLREVVQGQISIYPMTAPS